MIIFAMIISINLKMVFVVNKDKWINIQFVWG